MPERSEATGDGLAFRLRGVGLSAAALARGDAAGSEAQEARRLFSRVDLSLERGARLALLGESGGGKTTLLKLLDRLVECESGAVEVLGRPVAEHPIGELRRRVILVSHPALFGGAVRDELCVALRWRGLSDPSDEALRGLLRSLGLSEVELGREGEALSAGQRARVCLGRALLCEPELLLLDEPTGALDPRAARELIDALVAWSEERGASLVVVTHRPADAERLGGQAAFLLDGELWGPYPAQDLSAIDAPAVRSFLDAPPAREAPGEEAS